MVRTVKSHREADEIDDQDFVSSTPDVLSQRVAVKMEGKNDDQKVSALRSKHSETEQRRRSKINERFQSLRDLIPENDQKRDKASFLLEVIQYIQFLQERIQMYEGTYHRWSPEPSKFMPWRSNSGPAENSADQQQVARNGSGHDDGIVATPILSNAQKSLESELDGSPLYRLNDNSQGSGNHESSLNMSVQPNLFDVTSSHPARASFPDPEPSASQSPSDYWRINPCASECAAPSYNAVEQGHLKLENGVNGIPNVYSQGLFNTLSDALQSAGVDLSHTKIVVQLDVGKRSNETAGTTTQSTEDSSSLQQMAGNSMQSCDRASKKPRTDGS